MQSVPEQCRRIVTLCGLPGSKAIGYDVWLCYQRAVMVGAKSPACALLLALSLAGCKLKPAPLRSYPFAVRVTGDPGQPVPGATISFKNERVGTSSSLGIAKLAAQGQPGETLEFTIACPDGFRSPTAPLSVRLTQLGDPTKLPEYDVSCAPSVHNVIVAVRAENGPDLPVKYLGKEVARTDASGAAHFLVRVAPGEPLEVELDTTGKGALKPQNPAIRFVPRAQDEWLLFDQPFVVTRDPVRARAVRSGKPGIVRF